MKRYTKDGKTFYKAGDKVEGHYCVSEKWLIKQGYLPYEERREDGTDGMTDDGFYIHYLGAPYVAPEPEPVVVPEPTEAELLQKAIESKVAEINAYNDSDAVNTFTYGGQQMPWIDQDKRLIFSASISAAETRGEDTIVAPIGDGMQMPVAMAKQLMAALIGYCDKAGMAAVQAKAAVQAMTSREEVNAYDYKSLFPTPLAL